MLPGTAKISLPFSRPKRAVISAPLFSGASMTNIPRERPLIILFLLGKCIGFGGVPGGYSDITAPFSIILFIKCAFSGGYTISTPQPITAIVLFPALIADFDASVSIPRAMPLTIVTPFSASAKHSLSAAAIPESVQFLVPTTETASSLSHCITSPRRYKT